MSTRLDIAVDRAVCMGSGSCSFQAPSTFDLDDDEGKVVVLETRDPDVQIRAAADSCPTRAITLTERTVGETTDAVG
jgi:ferredoxin